MLNDIEFGTTTASSGSSSTTPRRRNRRKVSNDSDISFSSTASTSKKSIEKAKQKVQLQKEQRLIRFLEASDEELIIQAQELRGFARSDGGLINDEIRARVWPLLANCIDWKSEAYSSGSEESSSSCSDSDFETAVSSLSSSDSDSRNNVCRLCNCSFLFLLFLIL